MRRGWISARSAGVKFWCCRNLPIGAATLISVKKALDEREQLVAAMEKRVDAKLAELKQIQGRLEELAGQYSEREEKEYQRLVKIYEAMEPKDAARIFEELDPPVLLRVISRMKERKTAPILAEMNPKTARYVTTHMAERRQLPALGN